MENLPGAAAMAAALSARLEDMADQAARQWALTDRIRAGIVERVAGSRVHGHPTQRVPHIATFSVDGLDAEVLSMALDDRGFRIAAGSNCSGAPQDASPVLEHMGHPGTPAFRIGVGPQTRDADADRLLETLPSLVRELRRVGSVAEAAMARHGAPPDPRG
jgi:cysteine desulfurase